MSLSISWLYAYPKINSLLGRHTATSRVLGASQQREDEFVRSVESRGRKAGAFRGIPSLFSSSFEIESPGNFRGLEVNPVEGDPRFEQPPFSPPVDRSVSVSDSDEEVKFDRTSRVIPEDDVLFRQNRVLAEIFGEDAELRDAFISGDWQRVDEKLSQAAKDKLGWSPGISDEFLSEHPDEALLIAADLGGAVDLLADPEAAEALTGDVRDRLEDEIFDRLAKKATSLMKNSTILDEAFLREHPRAALFLMDHPEERRRIDGHREAEQEFRDHVTGYEERVDPVARAQALAGMNPALGEDFWQDNPGLSLVLCAEKAAGKTNSLQESALGFPEEPHQETTPAEMVAHDQARQARQLLGDRTRLSLDYLTEHSHLSRLINENAGFAGSLGQDTKVSELLGADDRRTERVLRAYVSGFPGRHEASWHWWA